jgi:hypothetical protein
MNFFDYSETDDNVLVREQRDYLLHLVTVHNYNMHSECEKKHSLGHCEAYLAIRKICPDCPTRHLIDPNDGESQINFRLF